MSEGFLKFCKLLSNVILHAGQIIASKYLTNVHSHINYEKTKNNNNNNKQQTLNTIITIITQAYSGLPGKMQLLKAIK